MTIGGIWQRYWFRPAPLFNLALCRVVCVGVQLAGLFEDRGIFVEHSRLPDSLYDPVILLRLILWPFGEALQTRPSYGAIAAIYWITLAAGGFALLGALTRTSLVLFAFGNLFLTAFKWSFNDFHHSDAIMVIFVGLLAMSPAGATLSLDDLSARLRQATLQKRLDPSNVLNATSQFARFPLLLTQHLFSVIYLNAGVSKLWVAGLDWANGDTLQYYLWRDGLSRGSELGVWLGQQHALAVLSSWITLVFECTFFLVLLWPRLLVLYVPLGFSLHLGMCLTSLACFVPYFALYSVFVPWASFAKRAADGFKRERLRIFFDGACVLCIRSMTFVGYWDWFSRLDYVDMTNSAGRGAETAGETADSAPPEMVVIRPDGERREGFFAWREILSQLPILWPLLVFLWIPGMSQIGPKVYRRIAQSRRRWGNCHDGLCSTGWR